MDIYCFGQEETITLRHVIYRILFFYFCNTNISEFFDLIKS